MPIPSLDEFLADPKHKGERDFLSGVIDARVKEIAAQYESEKKKKKGSDDNDNGDSAESGSFFDHLFGGRK